MQALHGQEAELTVASIPFQRDWNPQQQLCPGCWLPARQSPGNLLSLLYFWVTKMQMGHFARGDSAESCPQPDSPVPLRCSVLPRTWQPTGKSGCCSPSPSSPISSTAAGRSWLRPRAAGNHILPCPSAENRCTDPPKRSRALLLSTTDFPGH